MSFDGFKKYLAEKDISNYSLIIDKEGNDEEKSRTLKAAREIGLDNSDEADSTKCPGLRIADMMAGIISKLLKGLCDYGTDLLMKAARRKFWIEIGSA